MWTLNVRFFADIKAVNFYISKRFQQLHDARSTTSTFQSTIHTNKIRIINTIIENLSTARKFEYVI
jgi:hypothetical protein